jgi:hypothetical protein
MVFEDNNYSLFDEDDDFGVQQYRSDQTHVFLKNAIPVKLIKFNAGKNNTLQGNFLGTTLVSEATLEDNEDIILINIMSRSPEGDKQSEHGFSGRGEITYECYCSWDVDITGQDYIVFLTDYDKNIRTGEKYKVEMGDFGMFQGQYTRKNFIITKVKEGY